MLHKTQNKFIEVCEQQILRTSKSIQTQFYLLNVLKTTPKVLSEDSESSLHFSIVLMDLGSKKTMTSRQVLFVRCVIQTELFCKQSI